MDPADSHSTFSVVSQLVLQTLISLRGYVALRRLRHASTHLAATQSSVLLSILKHNSETVFGRRNRFADVLAAGHGVRAEGNENVKQCFVAKVPITTHDDYIDDIELLLGSKVAHAAGILSADRVEFFCLSSGTTGGKKIVPTTRWSKVSTVTEGGPKSTFNVYFALICSIYLFI